MGLDRDAFIANYLEELEDNLEIVDNSILALKNDPGNADELTKLLRALHTLKGSSRMLKFNTVEKISHGIENVFKGVKEERYAINSDLVQLVFITTDYIRAGAERIRHESDDSIDVSELLAAYEHAYSNEPYDINKIRMLLPEKKEKADSEEHEGAAATSNTETGDKRYETIRINVNRIEKIVKLLNNLIIRQFQLRKENEVLSDLETRLRKVNTLLPETQSRAVVFQEEMAAAFDDLKTLKKGFLEELPQIERSIFELQEEILSLRMLPLELIFGNLGKMVEETAMIMEKEIQFTTSGTELKLDKFILERLHDPIIHIVRNAIDHGIEKPEAREAEGKPAEGHLQILCSSESGNIIIRIKDDGHGFDYEKIRKRSIEMFPNQKEEIQEMDDAALNSFLFMSGFSTKDEVSELSGRGVGLDIVKHNIEKMKGKISLESSRGRGTEFKLSLPLSLATVNGFFISSAGERFLIPAAYVREIVIVPKAEELDLLNRKGYKLRNSIIPLYHLSAIMDKHDAEAGVKEKSFVVVVENLGEIIGVIVDSVIQYNSLIFKPVPKNLSSMKSVQGIVFDENYNIINILYIPEIINKFKRIRGIESRKKFSTADRKYKKVLVVDDSFSTREIEKSILEVEHYSVSTASDGIEGLEQLKEQRFDLIITDIHMPRMDGLTFVENLRKDDRHSSVPVIVVSSDENESSKKDFQKVGADKFIIKSDFDRGNLVREVKELIG